MSKKRRAPFPPPRGRKSIYLDSMLDTSETICSESAAESKIGYQVVYEDVPPPFKTEAKGFVTLSQISLTYKVLAAAAGIILTVIVPVVWFASSMNSDVHSLQEDVKEIKSKTEKLIENSFKQEQRIDAFDKTLNSINRFKK